jgi:hypothetical protein
MTDNDTHICRQGQESNTGDFCEYDAPMAMDYVNERYSRHASVLEYFLVAIVSMFMVKTLGC